MNAADRELALDVFRARLPARGAKARNDRLLLAALHLCTVLGHVTANRCPNRLSARGPCGRFGTKVRLKTDHDGLPIACKLTRGEASDSPIRADLMGAGPDQAPHEVDADKGKENRTMARGPDAIPFLPHRSNREAIPTRFAQARHQGRARIAQMMKKLKRF